MTTMKTPTKRTEADTDTAQTVSTPKAKRPTALRQRLFRAIARRQDGVDYEQMKPQEKKAAVSELHALAWQIQNEPDFLLTSPMIQN